MNPHHILIVGASVAGITCAEGLRAEGFAGRITVLGAESVPPYNRPPLSKQVLTGEWQARAAGLLPAGDLAAIDVELRLGTRAVGLSPGSRLIEVATAGSDAPTESVAYDTVVIATGVRPRRVRATARAASAGVRAELLSSRTFELRTLDDAIALRDALVPGVRVAVIGSGILGAEIAAAARKRGAEVTLVGRSTTLRLGQVGDRLSARLAALHRQSGVDVATADARGGVEADIVAVAIGCEPAVEWLSGSGLDLADGVVCDEHGLAAPGVYAIGDVAAWRDPATGSVRRAEHQLNAIQQAQAVARRITTGEATPPPLPFFWTELYGARIQAYGTFASGSALRVIRGDDSGGADSGAGVAADRFVAESVSTVDGSVVGVVGWNMPREFRHARARVGTATAIPSREEVSS